MFESIQKTDSLIFQISSRFTLIDRLVAEAESFFKGQAVTNSYNLRLVLRELLLNAVEHGNNKLADKTIQCIIQAEGGGRFMVMVKDQGAGFDFSRLDLNLDKDLLQERSRGLRIIHSIADRIEQQPPGGNCIAVYLTLPAEISFSLLKQAGGIIITPSGNLTSEVSEKLRLLLVDCFDKDFIFYQLNLIKVKDIDSLSLTVLFSFGKMLRDAQRTCEVEIINIGGDMLSLMEMVGLNQLFRLKQH